MESEKVYRIDIYLASHVDNEKMLLKIERMCCRRFWWQFWRPKQHSFELVFGDFVADDEVLNLG